MRSMGRASRRARSHRERPAPRARRPAPRPRTRPSRSWSNISRAWSALSPAAIISASNAAAPTRITPTADDRQRDARDEQRGDEDAGREPVAPAISRRRAPRLARSSRRRPPLDRPRRPIAHAADRGDVARLVRVVAELLAQPLDVLVDRPVEDVALARPVDRVEQLVAGQDAPVRLQQRGRAAAARARSAATRRRRPCRVARRGRASRSPIASTTSSGARAARRSVRRRIVRDPDDELGRARTAWAGSRRRPRSGPGSGRRRRRAPTARGSARRRARRARRMTARPSISGIIRSSTTSRGLLASIAASAARPSRRRDHRVALALEVGADERDDLRVVVDDEDRRLLTGRGGDERHERHHRRAEPGGQR